ncbi:hypothetical protein BU25DRAFT_451977 [Macroventuria anomochaeta]|uniref:Uncharacterized protein n=1 Tax=Macroventuria anomochaeta TaxID=301207 RepID=A0ACB6RLC7_9PLEO|nr:uncharacterized protein BU25DRAFT_451977 [Macroventuria anomochaeta]KAF2622681.1 hypothetical protein BU25DRAFT_451977 [Macroventuria anomochaeta]
MLFTTVLLAGIASAAPAFVARQVTTGFDPWEITFASAGSPSGRPGSGTTSSLQINIKQPNTILLQQVPRGYSSFPAFEASCSWSWEAAGNNFPVGVETLCSTIGDTTTYGNFTMTLAGTSQSDFTVSIKETREVTIFQQRYVRVFEGEQALKVGDGVWRQICGGSGVCNWQVIEGLLPIEVQQDLTTSIGSCEEASIGGC